jgi:hypothetical protein
MPSPQKPFDYRSLIGLLRLNHHGLADTAASRTIRLFLFGSPDIAAPIMHLLKVMHQPRAVKDCIIFPRPGA